MPDIPFTAALGPAPEPGAERRFAVLPSPLGELTLAGDGTVLTRVLLPLADGTADLPGVAGLDRDPAGFAAARAALTAYFAGDPVDFAAVPAAPAGSPFQRRVWAAVHAIPYGTTTSYGRLAAGLGNPAAARAVGAASARNPVAIVIPCHRVVGADGTPTGDAGSLARKRRLLTLEATGAVAAPPARLSGASGAPGTGTVHPVHAECGRITPHHHEPPEFRA